MKRILTMVQVVLLVLVVLMLLVRTFGGFHLLVSRQRRLRYSSFIRNRVVTQAQIKNDISIIINRNVYILERVDK